MIGMVPATVIGADFECFPLLIFIIIAIAIVSNFVQTVKKSSGSGGGSLFTGTTGYQQAQLSKLQDALKDAGGGTSFTQQGAGGYAPTTRARKKPPINWNLIKLNMTREQIRECFDMDALSRGVKKKDLPQYVNLDKLRNYFTRPQLMDLIDLEFFEEAASKKNVLEFKLKGLSKREPEPTSQQLPSLFEKFEQEKVAEQETAERLSERFEPEKVEERVKEERKIEKVLEAFHATPQEDPLFGRVIDKLDLKDKKILTRKIQEVASGAGPSAAEGDIVNGIIWGEILKRRSFGRGMSPGSSRRL